MAYFFQEPSHTFSEYLLVPGYSSEDCIPANVSLEDAGGQASRRERNAALTMNIPMVSAVMQAVSGEQMAHCPGQGGRHCLYLWLPVH